MNIKIIGKNSSNRIKLIKNLNKVKKDTTFDFEILEDDTSIKRYKDLETPIVMINDKIVSNGRTLSDREIKQFIRILN